MKIRKLFNIFTLLVLISAAFGFASCNLSGESSGADGDEKSTVENSATRICITVGNLKGLSKSTIAPVNLTYSDIDKAAVFADETLVKEWTASDSQSAVSLMTADEEVLIDGGLYDFTLRLYNSDNELVAISEIDDVMIEAGANPINFTTMTPLTGTGSVDITLNWESGKRIGKVEAGIFSLDDDTAAVTGFDYSDCEAVESNQVNYFRESVPVGHYYIKFNVYDSGNTTVICKFMDVIIIESGRCSSDERTISNVDELYSITYEKNGGEYVDGYTPVTVHNAYTGVLLPTENKIVKRGYKFNNWYDPALESESVKTRRTLLPSMTNDAGETVSNPLIKQDNTYTALWEAVTYKLTYKDRYDKVFSGDMPSEYSVTHTYDTVTALPVPSKTGYVFNGWYYDSECSGSAVSSIGQTDIVSDTVLYAKWTPITYKIKFDRNEASLPGGTVTGSYSEITCTYDEEYTLEDALVTAGNVKAFTYKNDEGNEAGKFVGWALTSDGAQAYSNKQTIKNISSTQGAVITFYAKWIAGKYAINFNSNGGSGITNGIEAEMNVSATLPESSFSRTGYSFKEWNTEADGSGTGYSAGETGEALASNIGDIITLYEIWEPNTYTVKFYFSGSRVNYRDGLELLLSGTGSVVEQSFTYDEEQALTLSTVVPPAGYYLSTWNTLEDGTGDIFTDGETVKNLTAEVDGVVNLYPAFRPVTYTVVYDANSSQPSGSTSTVYGRMTNQTTEYDSTDLVSVNVYHRAGYVLDGWSKTSDGAVDLAVDTAALGNLSATNGDSVTLYAHWVPVTYNVTYNCNGGTFSDGTTDDKTETHTYDVSYPSPQMEARLGYTFKGWAKVSNTTTAETNLTNETVKNASENQGEDVTLYAVWKMDSYPINYNLNGGSWKNASYPVEYTYLNGITLPGVTYIYRSGYAFEGWMDDSTGEIVTEIAALSSTDEKNYTAQWRAVCTSLTLSDDFILIANSGQSKTCTAYPVYADSNTDYTVIWKSGDTDIATVTDDGVIKAVNTGTTVVTAKVDDKVASCIVVVKNSTDALVYDTGTIPVTITWELYGYVLDVMTYYTNTNQLIAFTKRSNGNIDFVGRANTSSEWQMTSYSYSGWRTETESSGPSYNVIKKPVIAYDKRTGISYVVLYTVLTNTSETESGTFRLGYSCDVKIGSNDYAPVVTTSYGCRMYDNNAHIELQAHLMNTSYSEVTNIDHYWQGHYNGRSSNTLGTSALVSGQTLSGTDSALAFCWNDIELEPGESIVKCVYFTLKAI